VSARRLKFVAMKMVFRFYFEVTVISHLHKGLYAVRYANKATNLGRWQRLFSQELRLAPPHVHASQFSLNQIVDAFDNDGWWVGQITRKRGSNYSLYFATTSEETKYPAFRIRVHHD
jgi:hypothetical protein